MGPSAAPIIRLTYENCLRLQGQKFDIGSAIGMSRNLPSNVVKFSISSPALVEVNYRLAN